MSGPNFKIALMSDAGDFFDVTEWCFPPAEVRQGKPFPTNDEVFVYCNTLVNCEDKGAIRWELWRVEGTGTKLIASATRDGTAGDWRLASKFI